MALPSNFFATQAVLVVDDIDTIRSAIKGMLLMLGCQDIAVASNGNRALELCEKTQFDFILCDFNLGQGKDGYQLFEELKLRELLKSSTVFILVSAEMTPQVVHGLVELQPDDYLLKPFSYLKLENRLVKALEKRQALGAIYDALAVRDYKKALLECAKASKANSKNMLVIMRLKGEVLLNLEQPQLALELYNLILTHRDLSWARLGKAIAYYHLGEYKKSASLLVGLAELRETRIEALNWLASIYTQRQSYAQAKQVLSESVKLSPKNIPRHRALVNIALLEGDSETALRGYKSILENTRFSVHEHIDHHFNYIHCLLDQAKDVNQLQQAKIFAQIQPILKSALQSFDKALCQALEKIVYARINIIKGELQLASQSLSNCNIEMILSASRASGLALANAWFEFGDYEKYNEIIRLIQLPPKTKQIDSLSELLVIKKTVNHHQQQTERLLKLNEQGMQLYSNALYPAATTIFLQAHQIMPNNTQLSLNLAQSMIKGWPPNEAFSRKKDIAKQCLKVIEALQGNDTDQQKYHAVIQELKRI